MVMSLERLPHNREALLRASFEVCDEWIPAIVHANVVPASTGIAHVDAAGTSRFDGFVRRVGIARNILSNRLRRKIDTGFTTTVPQSEGSSRVDYVPTDKARALGHFILVASTVPRSGAPAALTVHEACGERLAPAVACARCWEASGTPQAVITDPWEHLSLLPTREVLSWFRRRDGDGVHLGDKWLLPIKSCLHHEDDTFDEVVGEIKIARNILIDRLRKLVAADHAVKALYSTKPQRFRYLPTETSDAYLPAMAVLSEWGMQWLDPPVSSARPRHKACGKQFRPVVYCAACHGS